MALEKFSDALIFLGSHNLSGKSNEVTIDHGAPAIETTVFGAGTRAFIPGILEYTISVNGFWDAGLDVPLTGERFVDDAIFPRIESLVPNQISVVSKNADLATAFLTQVIESSYSFFGAHGEAIPYSLTCDSVKTLARGWMALQPSLRTGAGNGTAFQYGTLTAAQTLVASLHVVQFNGTTMQMNIQSDDNGGFSTPTTRIAFTAATGVTSEYKTLAGPITPDDRFRAQWTFTGTSFTALVCIGVI